MRTRDAPVEDHEPESSSPSEIGCQRCGDPRQRGPLRDALPRLQPTGGYFNNLGALRSLGLIDYPEPGYVKAEPVLFLEG